ncbi:hypothetical protein KGF56_003285 [Candida oxycetoniae]|uniref:UBX domain-containing protein n=1 Tax=Candida oxycetoniae TaxID=497107 RepID=A0AAI9SWJ9_9ASCO|nr:uncharacterized protein KGF56_003285 [Candida oxycetoniae]KAI3403855.2 hypothetical protein KGF56_003285 [Candida oxycetoniae]
MTQSPYQSFGTSIEEAVQKSISERKPLLVFLAHQTNFSTNDQFLKKFIVKSSLLEQLETNFVLLKLVQNSTGFRYFEQLFSNLKVPSFYIVVSGKLKAVIDYQAKIEDFENHVNDVSCAQRVDQNRQQQSEQTSSHPQQQSEQTSSHPQQQSEQTSSHPQQQSEQTSSHPQQQSEQTSSHPQQQPEQPSSHPQQQPEQPSSHPRQSPQTQIPQIHPVMSDHEKSVQKYKEQLAEQRRGIDLEKQRLRDLIKADKRERESKIKAEKEMAKTESSKPPHCMGKGQNSKTPRCTLAIKLFDGSTIRKEFDSQDSLEDVRKYLDVEVKVIPSTSNMPAFATTSHPTGYSFHRPTLPRITYSEEQESTSLQDLDLTPRSILILKPIFKDTNSGNVSPGGEKVGWFKSVYNGLGKLASTLYLFFDYGVDDFPNYGNERPSSHDENDNIDLPYPVAPGSLLVGDRAFSSSLLSIETDDMNSLTSDSRLTESRASSPRSVSMSRIQTVHDANDQRIDTYNGNSINLNERDDRVD